MTVLKPCPFCGGGRARTIHIRDGRKVACICGACGKPEFHGPLDRPDAETRAITAWNTRTEEPTPSQTVSQDRAVEAKSAPEELADLLDWFQQCNAAVAELIDIIDAAETRGGDTIWEHSPEEIGLHVMENHREIRSALATFKKSEVGHDLTPGSREE